MAEIQSSPWTLTARWVFPVVGPPLPRGTVTIAGDRILTVERYGERTADHDLGNAALLPGLVNAHTHLDLGGLRGRVPPSADFTQWLRAVIAQRRALTPQQVEADIQSGLTELCAAGTTLVGDISAQGQSWGALADGPIRAVVFRELLGLPLERARRAYFEMHDWLSEHTATPTCRPGLSPHAPYSVHWGLFFAAAYRGVPVATHVAETEAELELIMQRRGPFVSFLRDLGVWDLGGLAHGFDHVLRLLRGLNPTSVVHGNFLLPDAAIPTNASVIYCPRTHAAFGHPPHPWRHFLARGVRVALGTDSLASNPDLDVLAEARFLHHRFPDVPGDVLLRLITLAGAETLGWQAETGSLEPGKSADLVVLPLPSEEPADPHALLFASSLPASGVLWRGRWVKSSKQSSA